MDIKVWVKNNILYIDYGYIRIGDLIDLRLQVYELIKLLNPPFQTINNFTRSVSMHWLPHEEEIESINILSNYLCENGRDHTVWVVPKRSLLYKSFKDIVRPEVFREFADSVEDAEVLIQEWVKSSSNEIANVK